MADEIVDDWEQHEGDTDMPEYAVGYNKGWDEGIKQARAEVLAACIKRVGHRPSPQGVPMHADDCPACQLKELQPAAKDLEALLREAKLEELRDWPDLCNHNSERHPSFCQYHLRIAELEKARAEGKG